MVVRFLVKECAPTAYLIICPPMPRNTNLGVECRQSFKEATDRLWSTMTEVTTGGSKLKFSRRDMYTLAHNNRAVYKRDGTHLKPSAYRKYAALPLADQVQLLEEQRQ